MRSAIPLLLTITLTAFSTSMAARPSWHWQDNFSSREKAELKHWVLQASDGLAALLGPLPFDYHVFFHRSRKTGEPVPWANTMKRETRDVHFHVDMNYSMSEFKQDWTAPHEITHLVFPYLGDSGRWFAEGIASYFQYQVMYANNIISWEEAIRRYADRFRKARAQGPTGLSIVELSEVVSNTGSYVRMYWGGAAYFMHVDQQLYEQHDLRLHDVISLFMRCCYGNGVSSVEQVITVLNRLSNSTVFTGGLQRTVNQKAFPETQALLTWLARHPPKLKQE